MKDLSQRLNRLTEELHALRVQLEWTTFQSFSPKQQDRFLNSLLTPGLVEDIKTVVDQLATFLWCYIELAAVDAEQLESPRPEVDYALQSKRLVRVAELLRLLRQSHFPDTEHMAFVARLTLAVDQHLEKARERELRTPRFA
jgi:hypothetical protein